MSNSDLPLSAQIRENPRVSDGEKMRLNVAEIKRDDRSADFTATLPFTLDLCALSVGTHRQSSEAGSPGKTRNPVKSLGGNRLGEVTSC